MRKFFWPERITIILFLFFLPDPVFSQQSGETPDTEKQIQAKYKKALSGWLTGNIAPWSEPAEEEVPEQFRNLSNLQRSMMRGEIHAPRLKHVELLVEALALQPGDTVLDFGCGMGLMESLLMTYGVDNATFIGLDIDTFALSMAPRILDWTRAFIQYYNASGKIVDPSGDNWLHEPRGFQFIPVLADGNSEPFATGSFTKLICVRTLHHLSDEVAAGMADWVKPGGTLIVIDHLAKKPGKSKCNDGGEVTWYLTRDELMNKMEQAGCDLMEEFELDGNGVLAVFSRR